MGLFTPSVKGNGRFSAPSSLMPPLRIRFLFIFIFDSDDFRAEFCNKPIARTPRPFGLILRLLIPRAVYCNRFLKRRKRSKSHEEMGVQSLGPRGETPFFIYMAFSCHPAPARYNTEPHRNDIHDPLQRRPEEKTSTWFALAASRVNQN